jgi:hypothetical protein
MEDIGSLGQGYCPRYSLLLARHPIFTASGADISDMF